MLYDFCATGGIRCTDGVNPASDLVADESRNLWGTTQFGGAHANQIFPNRPPRGGTVFELVNKNPGKTDWTHIVRYSFCAINHGQSCLDGAEPISPPTIGAGGTFYGVTVSDGAYGGGTVFELIRPEGGKAEWTHLVLHSFCRVETRNAPAAANEPCPGGSNSGGGVVGDPAGHLFGVTTAYGAGGGGNVFELSHPHPAGANGPTRCSGAFARIPAAQRATCPTVPCTWTTTRGRSTA